MTNKGKISKVVYPGGGIKLNINAKSNVKFRLGVGLIVIASLLILLLASEE